MNYLNRIIAVNSFLLSESQIDVYEIHGGAAILGTNTKGKSSFLRTQLIFYGAKPEYISALSGNRNLTNFYFKTDSSYLVFEYIKDGRPNLMVAFSSDRQSVSYRFVTGEYEDAVFTQLDTLSGKKSFIKNQDLKENLRSLGRHYSPILKYQEYASIIQSGKFERGSGVDGKRRNELRHKFSICPKDVSIQGVDRIALSIIDSSPSIKTIKKLLALDVADLEVEIQNNINDRTKSIDAYNRDIKIVTQAKKFQEKRPVVVELMSLRQTVLANKERLKGLKYESEMLRTKQQSNYLVLNDDLSSTQEKRQTLEDAFNRSFGELNTKIGQLKAQSEWLQNEIDSIEEQYQKYQAGNINEKEMLANRLPSLLKEKEQLNGRLEVLTQSNKEIIAHFEQELRQFKDEQESYLSGERQVCNQRISTLRKERNSTDNRHKTAIEEIAQLFNQQRHAHWEEKNSVTNNISRMEERQNNPSSPEIERIQSQMSESEKSLENANQRYRDLTEKKNEQGMLVQSLRDERIQKTTLYDNNSLQLEAAKKQLSALHKELSTVESMLYFQVLQSSPDKAELLAKTMTQEVLKSSVTGDLAVSGENSILGIDFDFGKFEPKRPDSKEIIEKKLKNETQEKLRLEGVDSALARELEGLKSKIETESQTLNQISIDLKTADRDVVSEQKSRKELKSKLDIAVKVFIDDCRTRVASFEGKRQQIEKQLDELETVESTVKEAKQSEYNAIVQRIENEITGNEIRLTNEENRIIELIKAKTAEFEQAKTEALEKAGAPTKAISSTEQQLQGLNESIEKSKKDKSDFDEYKLWRKGTYSKLPKLRADNLETTKNAKEANDQLIRLQEADGKEINGLKAKESEIERQMKEIEAELTILSGFLDTSETQFSELEAKKYFNRSLPTADEIQKSISKYLKENKGLFEQGRQEFSSLTRTFQAFPELVKLCSELIARDGFFEIGSANEWLNSIRSVDLLVNGSLDQEIQAREDSFRALGDQLLNLNSHLDEVDSRLSSVGRRITKHMSQSSARFDAIGELSAKITSIIPKLPFKKALVRASQVINDRKGLEPDEKFYQVITDTVSAIQREATDMDITKFIQVSIQLADKNGKISQANTDTELLRISSEGMSFMILVMIFVAIKNSIAHNEGVELLWSLDEVGRIHPENVKILSEMLTLEGISFLCAGTSVDAQVGSLFRHLYKIVQSKESGLDYVIKTEAEPTATEIFNSLLEETGL